MEDKETPYDEDLQKLRDTCPLDEDALIEVLGISWASPEAYYASLVFQWMNEKDV